MRKKLLYITIILAGIIFGSFTGMRAISQIGKKTSDKFSRPLKESTKAQLPQPRHQKSDFCLDVPVLFYHHIQPLEEADKFNERSLSVSPENFQSHIRYLQDRGYTLVTLNELVSHLIHREKLDKAAVITLDDGYEDNYLYAYPIIKKFNTPITIALSTWYVGRFDRHLTWKQVKEMYASGLVKFVSHSFSHRSLAISDEMILDQQINEAQKALENTLSDQPDILVYPYGKYNAHVIKYLEKQGTLAAFTVKEGTRHCLSSKYQLPRLRVGNGGPSVYGL